MLILKVGFSAQNLIILFVWFDLIRFGLDSLFVDILFIFRFIDHLSALALNRTKSNIQYQRIALNGENRDKTSHGKHTSDVGPR